MAPLAQLDDAPSVVGAFSLGGTRRKAAADDRD
jgi:hypothetical protein